MARKEMSYEQRLKAAAKIVLDRDKDAAEEQPLDCEEIGVTATLKPHQVEGVQWLIRRYKTGVNVILGDEMGLGKTLQAISFLSYLKASKISPGPFLVLCPLSVTEGWVSEIANFAPKLRLLKYVGDKEHRRFLRRTIYEYVNGKFSTSDLPFDVLLTTYDVVLVDQDFLSQIPWHYAVIDEAQRLKNPSSVLYNVLKEHFIMPRRLLLTGTPIQNNLNELWALMYFCMPSIFKGAEEFLVVFREAFREAGESSTGHTKGKTINQLKTLKYVLGAFMLRRTKAKLIEFGNLSLPSLTEITVMAPMTGLQNKVYLSILRKELPKLLAYSSGSANLPSLQNIVIQLRKACSHPYLFPGIEPEPYEEGEHLIQASGKLLILDELLQKLNRSGHRVLLFAQMTHTLDIQDFLELRKFSYERLDGSIRAEERFAAIRSFSGPQGKGRGLDDDQDGAFVFMISTGAGGVGLNLVAADTVIFYEQDWNPQVDKQALQRAHRIGQMNDVLSISIVTERSVEEVIMRRAHQKLQLSNSVVGDDETVNEGNAMIDPDTGDLRSIIFSLQLFDPADVKDDNISEVKQPEFSAMVEKVVLMRDRQKTNREDRRFELSTMNKSHEEAIFKSGTASSEFDASIDEKSYRSWVEKFRDISSSVDTSSVELGNRRGIPEERQLKLEASKKRREEEKLSKWQALGYHSLSVKDVIPLTHSDTDTMSDLGSVNYVYGDCTRPSKVCPSNPAIIFSCVDNSGSWGHGGMFDALSRLSTTIPDAYQRASEFEDLHLGDLHLIKIEDQHNGQREPDEPPAWVALAVVQSYSARRKVARSSISIPNLESCLLKASFVAAQNYASIHMPRIGYQDGSDRSVWYSVERLLRKYVSMYGIKIYVYYFKR